MGKNILITGKNSYIGNSFCDYTTKYGDTVSVVDTIGDDWKDCDFSKFNAVVHVAAIVHKRENEYTEDECFAVNTQLAYDIAVKAKSEGVSQFVLLSTMSVYGTLTGVITKDTELSPFNLYGKSKLEAERMISSLSDESFTVTVLRPPIVYGKGCRGNYVLLSDFARKMPFFPDFKSKRSMLYIDNLSAFIKKAIDEKLSGVFCPQDDEYVCTCDMVEAIAKVNGRKIKLTRVFNPLIKLALKLKVNVVCKVFGSLVYDKDMCPDFKKVDFATAIKLTEQK